MGARLVVVVALLASAAGGTALACGDKLAAMGGGIRFERVHVARHPGRVMLYLPEGSALRRSNDEYRIAELLRRSGHQVEVQSDEASLRREISSGGAGVVLIDVADARRVAAQVPDASAAPVLLVSSPGASRGASPAGCAIPVTRRTTALLLRAVDDALAPGRGTGACSLDQAVADG